jgi:hypothetical protein
MYLIKYVTIIVILVFFGIVFITGCVSQPATGNKTTNFSVTIPSSSNGPTQLSCPSRENETPYIIINPVSNFTIGDVFRD